MPPSTRHSEVGTEITSSTTRDRDRLRELDTRSRVALIAVSALAAAASWFVVRLLVARFVSMSIAGLAAFCAAWIALYPLSRLNRSVPAWSHWARGAFVLFVFWLLLVFFR
jgi:hypothetical protein